MRLDEADAEPKRDANDHSGFIIQALLRHNSKAVNEEQDQQDDDVGADYWARDGNQKCGELGTETNQN